MYITINHSKISIYEIFKTYQIFGNLEKSFGNSYEILLTFIVLLNVYFLGKLKVGQKDISVFNIQKNKFICIILGFPIFYCCKKNIEYLVEQKVNIYIRRKLLSIVIVRFLIF